jgi:hypothetical protein
MAVNGISVFIFLMQDARGFQMSGLAGYGKLINRSVFITLYRNDSQR